MKTVRILLHVAHVTVIPSHDHHCLRTKETEMLNLEVIFLTYLLVLDEGFDSIQVVPDLLVESIRNEFASIELI